MIHEGETFYTSEGVRFTTRDKVIDLVSDLDNCFYREFREWNGISIHESMERLGIKTDHWESVDRALSAIDNVITNVVYWRLADRLAHSIIISQKRARCASILKVLQR